MKEVKFWISGIANGISTDIFLMPKKWRETLEKLMEKYGVEYDEETDAYYLPRRKYFAFKREAKQLLGFSVHIYALK